MNKRLLGMAAAGAGATVAALGTGLAVERRVVATRRASAIDADRLGGLRSDPQPVTATDGLLLHAEVDEIAPYAAGAPGGAGDASDGRATVVLVHGYALNLDCWHYQRRYLRGRRRVVLYDQRSHGRSERSARGHASIDQLGRDLASVLEQLVPEGPVVLVGHSMGGMALLAFAEQHPEVFGERVVGAALISTTAGGLRPHRTLGRLIPDRIGTLVGPRLVAGLALAPDLVDSARRYGSNVGYMVTGRFAFGGKVPPALVEFVDNMLAGTSFDVLAQFFPHFESLDKYAVLKAFSRIPTVVLSGTKDVMISVDHSRTMIDLVDAFRLVEVRGAGHMVILERPDEVNDVIDGLLREAEQDHPSTRAS